MRTGDSALSAFSLRRSRNAAENDQDIVVDIYFVRCTNAKMRAQED
jgi:hypothetical protein